MIRTLLLAALLLLGLASPVLAKPLVAILVDPSGAETTDLTAPFAILTEAGAVEVKIVSTTLAPARLMPGVAWVRPHETQASFDRRHPQGADMIIVPFIMDAKNPERAAWLRAQARRGVRIVSICDGAFVLAEAGLLEGRQATAHWASHGKRVKTYPSVAWRQDARWVTDGNITTSAGISASAPVSLALLGELAGDEVMQGTARRLGLPAPSRDHDATVYRLNANVVGTAAGNVLAFWRHDSVALKLEAGFDELAFGAALDGWTRSYRAKAWAVAPGGVTSRGGMTIYGADQLPAFDRMARLANARAIEAMLGDLGEAYGDPTARFVALQLEHPLWLAGGR
ncbi:DJ-1/PfpI family protein [Phenylobacterium sp.]|uniref:DJ-1/PfpI family protein n=1 Tax=Phenylobacterium sp. TaxID=1871053 RepID=UPI00286C9C06|nr:DJ-1/PfpI family protein [Phenylobacterium sp.]